MMARTVFMIDVSFYQASNPAHPPVQPMDYDAACAQGIQGVYIKATQATYTDPELVRHYQGFGSRNIKRGAYHYFVSHLTGKAQGAYFSGVIGRNPWELPPAVDVEVVCTAKELWLCATEIHTQTGRWPMIYCNKYTWESLIKDGWTIHNGLPTSYKRLIAKHCGRWQAQWPKAEFDDGERIIKPDPLTYWEGEPEVHQYSCRNRLGRKFGSRGTVDIDLDLADEAWFAQFPWPAGQQDPEPEPEPEPTPEPTPKPEPAPAVEVIHLEGDMDYDKIREAQKEFPGAVLHLHFYDEAQPQTPPAGGETPPASTYPRYKVDAGDKQSGRVKVRTEPSPSVGGPTIPTGEIVYFLGRYETRNGTRYMFIRTEDGAYQGWVEDYYLQPA
jgi:hypothetical protein